MSILLVAFPTKNNWYVLFKSDEEISSTKFQDANSKEAEKIVVKMLQEEEEISEDVTETELQDESSEGIKGITMLFTYKEIF